LSEEVLVEFYQCPSRLYGGLYEQFVIKPSRFAVIHLNATDGEGDLFPFQELLLTEAGTAQQLGSRSLKKRKIAGVIHDAARIGVFVIHPRVPREHQ